MAILNQQRPVSSTPIRRVSSARTPGQRGSIPYGHEMNALDVMAENPQYGGVLNSMTAPSMTQGVLTATPQDAGFLTQGYAPQLAPVSAGVLTDAMAPEVTAPMIDTAPPPAPILSQAATGNARGSNKPPSMRVPFNEALIRIGGAIVGGSSQGGTAGLNAGVNAYGQIQDANRAADMAEFEIEEARRNEARRQEIAASMARGKAAREAAAPDLEAIGAIRTSMAKLASAKDMFTQDDNSSLTGVNPRAIWSRMRGATAGNEDEARRLFLNEVKLDSVMARIAETKGAISNAEMKNFLSQAPSVNSNAVVWEDWLDRQMQMGFVGIKVREVP